MFAIAYFFFVCDNPSQFDSIMEDTNNGDQEVKETKLPKPRVRFFLKRPVLVKDLYGL